MKREYMIGVLTLGTLSLISIVFNYGYTESCNEGAAGAAGGGGVGVEAVCSDPAVECDVHATCVPGPTGRTYSCACMDGYAGDGVTCKWVGTAPITPDGQHGQEQPNGWGDGGGGQGDESDSHKIPIVDESAAEAALKGSGVSENEILHHGHIRGHVHSDVAHPDFNNMTIPFHPSPNKTYSKRLSDKALPRVCVLVPAHTDQMCNADEALETPLLTNLMPSIYESVKDDTRILYEVWLGHNTNDPWYGNSLCGGDTLHEEVKKHVGINLKFRHLIIDNPFSDNWCFIANELAIEAHVDGCDYFYLSHEDAFYETPAFGSRLITALFSTAQESKVAETGVGIKKASRAANFGVVFGKNPATDAMGTQALVHRTHLDMLHTLFPSTFKDLYATEFLSVLYGSDYTVYAPSVLVKEPVPKPPPDTDGAADRIWLREVDEARDMIDEWLAEAEPAVEVDFKRDRYVLEPIPLEEHVHEGGGDDDVAPRDGEAPVADGGAGGGEGGGGGEGEGGEKEFIPVRG